MTKEEIKRFETTYGAQNDSRIILKAVFKSGKHTVQPAKDEASGWYAGVARLSDEEKKQHPYYVDPTTTKIVLRNNYEFNLDAERDEINWKWVRELPIISSSWEDAQMSPSAMFYVHIEGRETEKNIAKADKKYVALKYIFEDNPTNYSDRALILGQDFTTEHPNSIKDWLLSRAEANPQDIINLYQSKNTGIQLLYLKAKAAEFIKLTSEGVVKFENKVLGLGDDGALAYLMSADAKEIVELLRRRVYPEYSKKLLDLDSDNLDTKSSDLEDPSSAINDLIQGSK